MMLSWKDKVADKLSSLLADSPSAPFSSPGVSPTSRSGPPARSFSMEEVSSPKKSFISSFFLSRLPATCSGADWHESNKLTQPHNTIPAPLRSLPKRWKANSFTSKDKALDCSSDSRTDTESDDTPRKSKEDTDQVSERKVDGSIGVAEAKVNGTSGVAEAPTLHASEEFLSCLTDESSFISANLFEFLYSSIPNIVRGCKWVLLYSTKKDGISLRTLLRKSVNVSGPCLLIVGDMQGATFGGLLDSPLKPTTKRKYQGTSQTFVFTTIYGEPRLFRATGANRYYYLCLNDVLAFGGGGNFALCLDGDLLHGTSGPCDTFGNLCLAHSPEFDLKNVELWGFTHSSLYLT
ncbi:oxidation resistance protein 1 [Iris pallida]|uniref:Oxidation resistance protein 1 n=1 Tax=Iris pallida TaxID=29817 RepID=A0AAX6DG73_IRIPA|nr:oxidation resistance protein 1 [Iris pallida]